MNYCEKCKSLTDKEYCSVCGNKKIREVESDDFCFLKECEEMPGEMLRDVLQDEGIDCVLIPCGNGVRSQFALSLGKYNVYVPYKHYESSVELLNSFFNEPTTDDLKELLLANEDKWHIESARTEKKIRKKLNLSDDADIFKCIKSEVEKSQSIEDRGIISFTDCFDSHGLAVKIGKVTLWFSDESFEILI
ncbi:MAG: hypothetical protein J1F36_06145 [Clostridiales bacterium]|nr:hypothetical protein [Clostridiales bacterium]